MNKELQWYSVLCQNNTQPKPNQRWGHRLVKANNNLLLFGGYGGLSQGQGTYLREFWKFDLLTSNWQQLNTKGKIPESRSNYTMHFYQCRNQIIVFGGGTENKKRFNSVSILDLDSLIWRQILPDLAQEIPWERTYHTSQLIQKYLVVFGGEGVTNQDLDDLWSFDLQTEKWTRLQPKDGNPSSRRFASSAVVGTDLYVIGGCRNNYQMTGDIYKLSLLPLLQGKPQDLKWDQIIKKNYHIERWGHSSDVFVNKIYIFAGRVSQVNDNNDFLIFDCQSGNISKIQTVGVLPQPRRRHATAVVGDCLLVHGGYNAKYFKDFYFIKLTNQLNQKYRRYPNIANTEQCFIDNDQITEKIVNQYKENISIQVNSNLESIPTSLTCLKKYPYFSYHLRQNSPLKLPKFCRLQIFKAVNLGLIQGHLNLREQKDLSQCFEIAKTLDYYCCFKLLQELEDYLLSRINQINCRQILQFSIQYQLMRLSEASAQVYLKQHIQKKLKDSHVINLINQNVPNRQISRVQITLSKVREKYHFQLYQNTLRKNRKSIFSKTTDLIKSIFCETDKKQVQRPTPNQHQQKNCLQSVMSTLSKICSLGYQSLSHK